MDPWIVAVVLLAVAVLLIIVRSSLSSRLQPAVTKAVQIQPDSITLTAVLAPPWRNLPAIEGMTNALMGVGFVDAGTHTVDKMPGVYVRILVKGDECVSANLYDHPKREPWAELVTRYADGSSATATGLPDLGVPRPEWIRTFRLPGRSAVDLYRELVKQRPAGVMKPASPANAVQEFETGYVCYMTWLKNRELSSSEILAMVAKRHAAAGR